MNGRELEIIHLLENEFYILLIDNCPTKLNKITNELTTNKYIFDAYKYTTDETNFQL